MRSAYIIKNQLDKIGVEATLNDGKWKSMPFKCTVSPLWRKKSSAFDDSVTSAGINEARYHLYLGPKTHNILEIGEDGYLKTASGNYKFLRKNAVKINDEVIYYTGSLREIKEVTYDEY